MSPTYVINRKYIATGLPTQFGIVLWLLLDRLHAVEWVWGVVGTLYAFIFITCLTMMLTQKAVHPSEMPKP